MKYQYSPTAMDYLQEGLWHFHRRHILTGSRDWARYFFACARAKREVSWAKGVVAKDTAFINSLDVDLDRM